MLRVNQQENIYATRERETTNDSEMRYYEQVLSTSYTNNADGVTTVTLTIEVGARLIQIERNTQPMFNPDWAYNSTTREIFLLNGNTLGVGESLFIIYAVIRTS